MTRVFVAAALTVVLAGCHDPDAFVVGPDTIDSVLALTVSAATLPADGIARATIVAQIDPRTDANRRAVTFSTSAGTLIGGGKEGTTATVTADAEGKAIAELRSATAPGSARVDVTVGSVSRTTVIEFLAADSAQIISIELDTPTRPADGASAVNIVARVAAGLTPERREVTFRTTLGSFVPGNQDSFTIDADSGNLARATLVSTAVGLARVTAATADGVSASADVTFSQSLPDSLFVSPAAAILKAGDSTRVRVTLLRAVGTVSPRLQVSYSAATSTGAVIGVFSDVSLSDDSGVSEATFHVPTTTTYLGRVVIRAAVGDKVGTATIEIVP
jgi:hypothetical protein